MNPQGGTYTYEEPTPPTPEELAAIEITREGRNLFDKLSRKKQRQTVEFMRKLADAHTLAALERARAED